MKPAPRPGITPVVAIVLLLMMTVAASGGAYAWVSQIQSEAESEADQGLSAELAVKSVTCEGSIVTVAVSNTGSRALTATTADIYIYEEDELVADAAVDVTGEPFLQPGGVSVLHVPLAVGMADGTRHTVELTVPSVDATVSATCQATNSLVSYYRFEEGSGTWANDSAGTNHGRLHNGSGNICVGGNCPTWTTGVLGGALDFDGVHDYVDPSWDPPSDRSLTYMAWYNRDGDDGIIIGANPVCNSAPSLWVDSSGTIRFEVSNTDDTCVEVTGPGSAGSWIHAAGVADVSTGEIRLYINGSLAGTASGWDGNTDGGTLIGNDDPTAPEYDLDGRIDELQIHSTALSKARIHRILNATAP